MGKGKDKDKTKDQAIAEEAGVAGIPDETLADAQARTSISLNPDYYRLPGCAACGGIAAHRQTCAAYDPNNIISVSAGWCAPSEAVYAAAGETIPESVRDPGPADWDGIIGGPHAPGDDGKQPPEEEGRTPWCAPVDRLDLETVLRTPRPPRQEDYFLLPTPEGLGEEAESVEERSLRDSREWGWGNPRFLQPVPTLEDPLDVDQLGRVEALKAARAVLQTSAGVFGGSNVASHSVDDLIRVARFITTGQDPQ